jgi:predicted HAD superfamily Cof-like phosphohydrolase
VTQLERAAAARKKLLDLFPQIADAKAELELVLEEARVKDVLERFINDAQNQPSLGVTDGTIDELKFRQLSSVKKGADDLLISLLFWNGKDRHPAPVKLSLRDQVLEFHRAFDHPVRETPGPISNERVRFRLRLLAEEFFEVLGACFVDTVERLDLLHDHVQDMIEDASVIVNLAKLAEGIADLNYVSEGMDIEFGINSGPIAAEVHRSNMTKLGGGKRADGKSMKTSGWVPPDIDSELRKQGWNP